jgi:hypothetical protein
LHPLLQGVDIESKNHRLCNVGQRGKNRRITQIFTRSCQNQPDTGDRGARIHSGFDIFIIIQLAGFLSFLIDPEIQSTVITVSIGLMELLSS